MDIQERANEWCDSIINRIDTSDLYRGYVQGALEERAEFKEYLEKKLESIRDCYQESKTEYKKDYYSTQMVVIAEIINELFGEIEQDNSDREE